MEALKNIAAVVMDKTGTVTKGNFVLQKVNAAEGMKADELLRLCASAELVSTHPIAVSIVEAAKLKSWSWYAPINLKKLPAKAWLRTLVHAKSCAATPSCCSALMLNTAAILLPKAAVRCLLPTMAYTWASC